MKKYLFLLSFILIVLISCQSTNKDALTIDEHNRITNLLKDSLGFEGVVISDDMLMKALGGSLEENAIKAIRAGVDILLVSEYFYNKTNSIKALNDAIFNAVKSGEIQTTRIIDAYNRIIAQKARF